MGGGDFGMHSFAYSLERYASSIDIEQLSVCVHIIHGNISVSELAKVSGVESSALHYFDPCV